MNSDVIVESTGEQEAAAAVWTLVLLHVVPVQRCLVLERPIALDAGVRRYMLRCCHVLLQSRQTAEDQATLRALMPL